MLARVHDLLEGKEQQLGALGQHLRPRFTRQHLLEHQRPDPAAAVSPDVPWERHVHIGLRNPPPTQSWTSPLFVEGRGEESAAFKIDFPFLSRSPRPPRPGG